MILHPLPFAGARKLPAGALSLVLVISIVISAILLSLISLAANYRLQQQQQQSYTEVRRNTRSAIAFALGNPDGRYFHPTALDLFGNGNDSVWLTRKPWGLYDIAITYARKGTAQDTLVALLGSKFSTTGKAALFLAEDGKPLSLVGSSQVVGDAYLPAAGIRTGYLAGNTSPTSRNLVTGTVRNTSVQLPVNADSALTRVREYCQLQLTAWLPTSAQMVRNLQTSTRRFHTAPLIWYQPQPLTIKGGRLAGQIMIVSTHKIIIESSAHLEKAIVIAPVIVLKSGVKGSMQLFARDTVEVQSGCDLTYPSAVCAYAPKNEAVIMLGEKVRLSGALIATASAQGKGAVVRMHSSTQITGQVFANGSVENCGQITGTLMCRRLLHTTPASYYENYLVNATLNRQQLPEAFLTSPLLNPGATAGVVAWLN